jgi:hypothetical protein
MLNAVMPNVFMLSVVEVNDAHHNDIRHNDIQHRDIQHNSEINVILSIMTVLLCWVSFMLIVKNNPFMLSVILLNCRYAECSYVECRGASTVLC